MTTPRETQHATRNLQSAICDLRSAICIPLLLLITLAALALRVVGIGWGLNTGPYDKEYHPYQISYHPDEYKIVDRAIGFPRDVLTNENFLYPTFVPYSAKVVAFLPVEAVAFIHQRLFDHELDRTVAYFIVLRLYSVLAGVAAVPLTYLLGRKLYGPETGLLSAALLTVSMIHARNAHFATVDVPSAFFLLLALYLCYNLDHTRPRTYVWVALASGILVGTKQNGAIIVLPVAVAHIAAYWRKGELTTAHDVVKLADRNIIAYGLIAALTFVATTPGTLTQTAAFVNGLRTQTTRLNIGHYGAFPERIQGHTFLIKLLINGVGWPLALVSLLGVLYAVKNHSLKELIPLCIVIPYYAYLGTWAVLGERYWIIVLPPLAILTGNFLSSALHQYRNSVVKYTAALAAIAVVTYSFFYSAAMVSVFVGEDPRTAAFHYLRDNVPPSSFVYYPLLKLAGNYRTPDAKDKPDYIVLAGKNYTRILNALDSEHLVNYVWDKDHEDVWYLMDIPSPDYFKLVEDLVNGTSPRYELIKTFRKTPRFLFFSVDVPKSSYDFTNPWILVYRLKTPPPTDHPADTRFAGKAALFGYDLGADSVASGGELPITLYWRCLQPMDEDYNVFMRLTDERGHVWGQANSPPVDGLWPTTHWQAGMVVRDRHDLAVRPGTPPGEYRLEVGLYSIQAGQALGVAGGAPVGPSGGAVIGMVTVTKPAAHPDPSAIAVQHRTDARLSDDIELLGYDFDTQKARPGDRLSLTLYWRATANVGRDYLVSVRLRDGQGETAEEWQSRPAEGRYPTAGWAEGEIVADQTELALPASTPAGRYRVTIGLMDSTANEPPTEVELGRLDVEGRARTFDVPPIQHPQSANFDNKVEFMGYDLESGDLTFVHLTLYWKALAEMDTSYTVFIHLLDSNQRIWAQRDSIPGDGTLPTTGWIEGEIVADEYTLSVEESAPQGKYAIEVGLYDVTSGQRLPILDESGHVQDDRTLLSTIIVAN